MSLTLGTGPFGQHPTGRFDFEPPECITFVEVHPRRVRAVRGAETVIDSERVRLVYRSGSLPHFAFPAEDVHVASEAEPAVDGYVTVRWSDADRWFEEEDEIIAHPRDPYHRIDVLATDRRVLVRVAGEELAESTDARILFETGLPPRYYLPKEHVRTSALSTSAVQTGCAYKGFATHYDHASAPAIAWSYEDPRHDAEPVRGFVCFYQERAEVEVELDGVVGERPRTPWADPGWTSR